ncbi:MAG TPA: DUF1844 domain-containing protein [Capsulimonadaceae bacterium]|nr:DUF1844 domain-containing protein [Capsulimonadaceae bacterium]
MAKDQNSEPEEGFTFVDKRRAASPDANDVTPPEHFTPEDAQTAQLGEDLADADADADSLGTYGLATYVIGLLATDAWQRLGLIANPVTGKVEKDLGQARVGIDCVSALITVIDVPESNLPESLRGDLRRVLSDLRVNFVEQSRR